MKTRHLVLALALVAIVAGVGYGLYRLGMEHAAAEHAPGSGASAGAPPGASATKAGDIDPANGRKVLYWHDPMTPAQKFDKPGKSPFMDMPLVPVYADGGASDNAVSINPRVQQNLGVRTAEVKEDVLTQTVEAVGNVAYNERDVAVVQARSNGYLERLFVRAPLDPVRRGQPLAELYVPDWVAAQEEYLSARRIGEQSGAKSLAGLADAARQRMRLAGMNEQQIQAVERDGKVQARLTITAPISGVVGELSAREGMTVMAGAPLFRLNGLSTVWVNAEVPETMAAGVRPGHAVEVRASALPGRTFKGKVGAILPEVNPATRTLKARIEVANPGGQLVPGMFANVDFATSAGKPTLLVPSEAIIRTGTRTVVIVAQPEGRFAPVEVEAGLDSNGQTEIRRGLQAGQKVVVSGQFLVDSEASLKATTTRMSKMASADAGAPSDTAHHGAGKVESIGKDEITISHGAIATLQWPAMTMGFKLPASGLAAGIGVGDRVDFAIRANKEGAFQITSISPAGASAAPGPAATTKGSITAPSGSTTPEVKR